MPASDQDRARRSLLNLRGEFEHEASRDPQLSSVLLCASHFDHPKAAELPPVPRLGEAPSFQRAWCGPDGTLLLYYYYGETGRLPIKFASLAVHASTAWAALTRSHHVPQQEPTNTPSGVDWAYKDLPGRFKTLLDSPDTPLWLLVVHSLAWKRMPGSSLVADRQVWDRDWPVFGHFTLPYELERRPEALGAVSPPLAAALRDLPRSDYYFSILPCDVFRASIFAIDLLLEADSLAGRAEGVEPTSAENSLGSTLALETVERSLANDARPRPCITKAEAERRATAYLEGRGWVTLDELYMAIGVTRTRTSKLDAWKLHLAIRQQPGLGGKTRNTRGGKLEIAKSSQKDVSLDLIDEVEPYYLERASGSMRSKYDGSNISEKGRILFDFLESECSRATTLAKEAMEHDFVDKIGEMIFNRNYATLLLTIEQTLERFKVEKTVRSQRKS